jgi:hypothetical protein
MDDSDIKQVTLEAYNELTYYTLSHRDPSFIHQEIVDAYAAQTADNDTKPIKITFALIGLYLYVEKGFTGKQVQNAHMQLAKMNKQWPSFSLPANKGDITALEVIKTNPGKERDLMIHKWCQSVWKAYSQDYKKIEELVTKYLFK